MGLSRGRRGGDIVAAHTLYHKTLGSQSLIPPKFRRQVKSTILTTKVPADYKFPNGLNGSMFIDLKQDPRQTPIAQLTTIEETLLQGDGTTSYHRTQNGQLATCEETLIDEDTPPPPMNSLTEDLTQEALGDGNSILKVCSVDSLYTDPSYSTSIPDVIPEKFRAAVPTFKTGLLVEGTASQPVLGTGDLERAKDQQNVFVYRDSRTFRDPSVLPVTLIEYKLTPEKQVETVSATLNTGLQTITADALTIEASVDNLGNNTSLYTKGVVAALYEDRSYNVSISDPVPERFRVAVPVRRESYLSAGNAGQPTLGTGELDHTSEQVNVFVKKDSSTFRDVTVLPVSLIDYKLTKDKQIETLTATLATGLQTITANELTVEASVDNLGNNTSLYQKGVVPTLYTEPRYTTSIPDPIPEKFRVVVPTLRSSVVSAGTAAQPTLGTGELSRESEQVNVFVKRDTVEYRDPTTLPVSLVDYKLTPEKQIETVTLTLATGVQTITADSLTIEASVDNLGNNTSLKTFGAVPSLYTDASFTTSIPDPIPEKFRVVTPTLRSSLLSAGTAAQPTLGTGELSRESQQVNVFVKKDTVTYRDPTALPVTLVEYKMTPEKQLETISTTLATGLQTISPDGLTIEASVDNLGNNTSLKTTGTVTSLYTDPKYSIQIPDVVPEKFRVAVPTQRSAVLSLGTAAMPTLAPGELSRQSDQVNAFVVRNTVESRSTVGLPVSLIEYKLTREKQVETVTSTLDTGLQTITANELTIEANVDNLGNGTSLLSKGTVSSLYTDQNFSIRIPDVVPEKFRVAVPTQRSSAVLAGTANMPVLGTGELSRESQQVNVFVKRDTVESRATVGLPISLVEYKLIPQKQIETLTTTYNTGLQTITANELTIEANVDNLGNNTSLLSKGVVPALYTDANYSITIPDVVPEKFRVAVPTQKSSVLSAGTAAPPTLGTGELSRQSDQVNAFVKRDVVEFRSVVSLPISLVESKLTPQKQIETITTTLDTGVQTITANELTVEASVDNLGNGTSLLSKGTVPALFTEPSYTKEIPDVVPHKFKALIPVQSTAIISVGTACPPTLGTGDLLWKVEQINAFVKKDTRH